MKFASLKRAMPRPSDAPDALAGAEDQAGTTVFIRDLSVSTLIGVHAYERRKPRALLMDLDIELHGARAGETDHLADTIDYAAVVEDIRRSLAQKSHFLLERLAEFVAGRVLEEFGAKRVCVQVAKAGILKDVGLVGVRIERRARPERVAGAHLRPVPSRPVKAQRG